MFKFGLFQTPYTNTFEALGIARKYAIKANSEEKAFKVS